MDGYFEIDDVRIVQSVDTHIKRDMDKMNLYNKDILNVFKEKLPWNKLSGCNILITGATGLIGGCLVETLMLNPKRDYNVYALGRNKERASEQFKPFLNCSGFYFIKHDVTQPLEDNVCFCFTE